MKKAFTLIEMLVVIGIIAVLMGVLLPMLTGASDAAKAAKCLANMHSLAMGVQAGVMEAGSNAHYPFAGSFAVKKKGGGGMEAIQGWLGWPDDDAGSAYLSTYSTDEDGRRRSLENGTIWKYVNKNADIYCCPCHRDAVHAKGGAADRLGPCWSYVMNAAFKWNDKGEPYAAARKWAGVYVASYKLQNRAILFAELPFLEVDNLQKPQFDTGASTANDPILQYAGCDGDGEEIIGFNHSSGKREIFAHVCYVDGHTAKFRLPRNFSASNLKDLTTWLCEPGQSWDVVLEGSKYLKTE